MSAHLPRTGKILDLGCGHGFFSLIVAASRPSCCVLGIDHDESRVELARQSSRRFNNVEFRSGDLRDGSGIEPKSFSGISIIDTLHYFSSQDQESILNQSYRALDGGGVCLVREVDRRAGLRSGWNRIYETLATHLKFTKTDSKVCHYRSPNEWGELLSAIGYSVTWKRCSNIAFSDVLFVATKAVTQ